MSQKKLRHHIGRHAARRVKLRLDPEAVIGIGWYTEEQWQALTTVVPDRGELDDSYAQWLAQANQGLQELRAQGFTVVRMQVDVEALVQWCRERGLAADGQTRAAYVSDQLKASAEQENFPQSD